MGVWVPVPNLRPPTPPILEGGIHPRAHQGGCGRWLPGVCMRSAPCPINSSVHPLLEGCFPLPGKVAPQSRQQLLDAPQDVVDLVSNHLPGTLQPTEPLMPHLRLLLGRLHAEALPEVAPVYGAGFGSGRYEEMMDANSVLNAALLRTPASDLTEADAINYACRNSIYPAMEALGYGPPRVAAGYDVKQWVGIMVSRDPLVSQKLQPADDVPRRILTLISDGRRALLTAALAGFGRAIGEVGAIMIVGGNIDHATRVLTTAIALETGKGDFALALGLGFVLIALALSVNLIIHALSRTEREGRW